MPLFDYTENQSQTYGNAFNPQQYARDSAWFAKQKHTQDAARPWWQAALQFIPFGIGNAISPAIEAGIAKGRSDYQKRLDRQLALNEGTGFDYGFDQSGQFFPTQKQVLSIDTSPSTGQVVAGAFGGIVNSGAQWYNSGGKEGGGFETAFNTGDNSAITPYGQSSLPTQSSTDVLGGIRGISGEQITDNPSSNYANGAINLGDSNEGLYKFKNGGRVVVGGNGDDDIALVEEDSGKDTGVRVSKGEMLVVNKDRLNALKKALQAKDQKEVFNIIKAQVNEPTDGENYIRGGALGMTELERQANNRRSNRRRQPTKAEIEIMKQGDNPVDIYADYESSNKGKFNWQDTIESGIGNVYDAFRMAQGFEGANTPIPTYHKSGDWINYLARLKNQSNYGFSPAETANFRTQQDRTYATDVANIYNLSGGSNAIALGNLGRLNTQNYLGNLGFAAADAAQQRANMAAYGGYLGQDVNIDRQIFMDKLNQATLTKQAGAQLARDARENMQQRALTNRFYGAGSQQEALQNAYLKRIQNENEITQMNLDRWMKDPNAFNPYTGNIGDWEVTEEDEIDVNGEKYVKKKTKKKV